MSIIPEGISGYNVYDESGKLLGVDAECTLPDFESVTSEVSGPGLLGSMDNPTPGYFGPMSVALTFRTVSKEAVKLNEPRAQMIILRASQRGYDPAAGQYSDQKVKIVLRGLPKKLSGGKLKAAESVGMQVELGLSYVKIELNGEVLVELDKYNYIYVVNGVDYMEQIRKNI